MNQTAEPLQQIKRTYVRVKREIFSYFGGCDYFRLSSHPQIVSAVAEGLGRYGLNVAASRKTTGNHAVYEQLERSLARFFAVESAVLVSSGYVASLAFAQAMAGQFSRVLIDDAAHAALFDAARFLDCAVERFPHRSVSEVQQAVTRAGRRSRLLLLTDGMFSRDGELAPLGDYLKILPPSGLVLVDDAHGVGTLGPGGRGTAELLGVATPRLIQAITLSKAFGVYGGAILATAALCEEIVAKSRLFVGNTPLPPPLAHAASQSLRLIRSDRAMRRRLEANTKRVKGTLRRAGFPVAETPSPIVSLFPRDAREAAQFRRLLLARRIYPSLIRYPGGPPGGYFRFALSSEHEPKQLDDLLSAFLDHLALTAGGEWALSEP